MIFGVSVVDHLSLTHINKITKNFLNIQFIIYRTMLIFTPKATYTIISTNLKVIFLWNILLAFF